MKNIFKYFNFFFSFKEVKFCSLSLVGTSLSGMHSRSERTLGRPEMPPPLSRLLVKREAELTEVRLLLPVGVTGCLLLNLRPGILGKNNELVDHFLQFMKAVNVLDVPK